MTIPHNTFLRLVVRAENANYNRNYCVNLYVQPIYSAISKIGDKLSDNFDVLKTYSVVVVGTVGPSLINVELIFKIFVLAATAFYTIFKALNEYKKWQKNRKCKKCDED